MGMDAACFKNPFYERLPRKGSFAFGSRFPVPGEVISADRECPEIEIMETVTVPSSRRQGWRCRSGGPFPGSLRTRRVSWETADL